MASEPIYINENYHGIALDQVVLPKHYLETLDKVMISSGLIKNRVEKLSMDVHEDYIGKNLLIIGVLKGGQKVLGDLTHHLENLNGKDIATSVPFETDFWRVSSYENDKSTNDVKLSLGNMDELKGKHILFVEDIIDTGKSMTAILNTVNSLSEEYKPKSVRTLSLLVKRTPLSNGFKPDYAGFSIPNLFVVGYCMDYNEKFRDLSHLCVINANGKDKYKK